MIEQMSAKPVGVIAAFVSPSRLNDENETEFKNGYLKPEQQLSLERTDSVANDRPFPPNADSFAASQLANKLLGHVCVPRSWIGPVRVPCAGSAPWIGGVPR